MGPWGASMWGPGLLQEGGRVQQWAGWPPLFTLPSLCPCLLSISDQRVASVAINSSGDWIAFGCSGLFPCPAVEGKFPPKS